MEDAIKRLTKVSYAYAAVYQVKVTGEITASHDIVATCYLDGMRTRSIGMQRRG